MHSNGQRWATGGLIFGAAISLMGNVAHTFLADSTISLLLRVPLAVLWPVALFVGIEILVRIDWRRNVIDWFGKVLLVGPVAAVGAVVSYLHLHSLMGMAGEDWFSKLIGPAAIDGLMLGSTVALLALRAHSSAPEALSPEEVKQAEERLSLLAEEQTEMDWSVAAEIELGAEMLAEAPISPAPAIERAPRGEISPYLRAAVEALMNGERPEVGGPGASAAVVGRYSKVLRTLRDNPNASIDIKAEKVKPEIVDILRSHAREVAPR